VTATARRLQPADGTVDWLTRVRAELRDEFAGGVILAGSGGPALMGRACAVDECWRVAQHGGLCEAHHKRWVADDRPDIGEWSMSAPGRSKGVRPLQSCDAQGCRRGRFGAGLCQAHLLRWARDGKPDRAVWLSAKSGPPLETLLSCPIPGCLLEGEGSSGLCVSHQTRWVNHGRPPIEEFVIECVTYGHDRFDLRHLPPLMRAEFAYGLQRRADEVRTQTRPDQLRRLLKLLPAGVDSLCAHNGKDWLEALGWADRKSVARRFLIDTLGWLDDLANGVGWDSEFDRDVWQLRRLGYPNRESCLRFDRIEPMWLRMLAKRWARWRLSTGMNPTSVSAGLKCVIDFATASPELDRGPQALTRDVIERHLARLAAAHPNPKGRTSQISQLAGLLRTARQHGWEPRIAATAQIYREDYPRAVEPAPRAISEAVMAQLEDPANLARFNDRQARVLAEILMATGLRVGDGTRLAIDCVVRDPHGAPYLAYRNHKMRRDAKVPIDTRLAATISDQQQRTLAQFSDAQYLLVREKRNPLGQLHYSADTFRTRLHDWLAVCEIRDELGRPVHVTPHQWRHTFATRLINGDVSQEVVRRLLDHTTHTMTARYARLSQQTLRAKWQAARKVDIYGADVIPPSGDLADAQWMRNNIDRAKMALPNGYCTLPIQQNCEYANACLTCAMFVTTAEFLPAHHEQLASTRRLIARGEADGQLRLIEMNRRVEANLTAIINTLDNDQQQDASRHAR
jgi:integrase/ferredoxin